MKDLITLDRTAHTVWGTFGRLQLPDGTAMVTLERQWEHNAKGKSCIPAGTYGMEMRNSPIVARITKGLHSRGWEIQGVPGRSLIMIHPGNWQDNSNGCVLVGRAQAVISGKPGISASGAAFDDLMRRLSIRNGWQIQIRWTNPETQGA